MIRRALAPALVACGLLALAGPAAAERDGWQPYGWGPAPGYYPPPPAVYHYPPPPVYYYPPPVVYVKPRPRYYAPPPVVYYGPRHHYRHHHHHYGRGPSVGFSFNFR